MKHLCFNQDWKYFLNSILKIWDSHMPNIYDILKLKETDKQNEKRNFIIIVILMQIKLY
jgi:hypothetical protein